MPGGSNATNETTSLPTDHGVNGISGTTSASPRPLSILQVLLQVSVVILVRPYHNKLQITAKLSIGEKILRCFVFELVYEYTP